MDFPDDFLTAKNIHIQSTENDKKQLTVTEGNNKVKDSLESTVEGNVEDIQIFLPSSTTIKNNIRDNVKQKVKDNQWLIEIQKSYEELQLKKKNLTHTKTLLLKGTYTYCFFFIF